MPKAAAAHHPAGRGKDAVIARRRLFANAYLANGRNATQAAITAGFSKKTAYSQGQRLLKRVEMQQLLAAPMAKIEAISGLTAERVLLENARIVLQDHRKFYRPDGTLIPLCDLDDDTAAAVAGVRADGYDTYDKLRAIDMAMKNHGLYGRDNAQSAANLSIRVVLVG